MMADLPISGFIGSADLGHRIRCGCRFFTFGDEEPVIADNYLSSFRTTKMLGEPAGTWQVTLTSQPLISGQPFLVRAWHEVLTPGDWVLLDAADGVAEWPIMLGIVERIHRSRRGPTVTYTVSGRDIGKCFDTDIIVLPQFKSASALDIVNSTGPFFGSLGKIIGSSGRDGVQPGEIIPALALFFLGSVTKGTRGAAPVFHTPRSLRAYTDVPVDLEAAGLPVEIGLPFGEIVRFLIDPEIDGRAVMQEAFEGIPDGLRLWDFLASWANTEINELFVDFLPRARVDNGARPMADLYQWSGSGPHPFVPTLVLRQRPFPHNAFVAAAGRGFEDVDINRLSGEDLWRGLPWTAIDETMLTSDETGRSDAERANFFLAVPHASYTMHKYTLALATAGRGEIPVVDGESPARYGWRRREMSSPFLPTDPRAPLSTYYVWSRMLADWYGQNQDFLAGDLEHARMLPGIRVGEKLIVHRKKRTVQETYYVEGVTHSWQKSSNAKETSSTALVVTRGSPDPMGGFRSTASSHYTGSVP